MFEDVLFGIGFRVEEIYQVNKEFTIPALYGIRIVSKSSITVLAQQKFLIFAITLYMCRVDRTFLASTVIWSGNIIGQKLKCRNRSCRADLQGPGQVPASKLVQARIPRNPLLSNHFQALLTEAGAVECLSNKIAPPPTTSQDIEKEDPDEPMEDAAESSAQEDPRTKTQVILDFLAV